jgi:small-conductance mechanosensitive channel
MPQWLQDIMAKEYFGNTVQDYGVAVVVFALVWIGLWVLKHVVIKRLARWAEGTRTNIDNIITGVLRRVGPVVYLFLALWLATRGLALDDGVGRPLEIVFVVILTVKVVQLAQDIVRFLLEKWVERAEMDEASGNFVIRYLMTVFRLVLWAGGLVFVLDNVGIEVTSIVAGLGIGGIAIALAAQAVLGDAFSSFAIFMDKPFQVGDFIIVGDMLGTVEHVGFKTTRLRSLGGEQIVMSNTDLTSARVRNYKRMQTRRIVFKVGVIYQTPAEKVKAIAGMIREIIETHEQARFDRAHFQSFGDFALIYEVVYHVQSPDYNVYMDVQQSINLALMERFEEEGIEFAYPTQQLFVTSVEPAK